MSFINTVFGIPLGYVMWGCYQLVKNYGLSIILFTLVSKIVMLPVSIMVQKNSIRMIQIQPQINEIKYKHAGDKDRIADEQMELFKKAHYSPMLGMVPMLLQIPLVLGLINVIYNPMQHLMHIKTSVCDQIVAATCSLMGVDKLGSGAQLQAMAALQNPDNLSFFQNALTGTGIDIEAIAAQAATINTHFLGSTHYCIGMDPSYSTVQLSFYCFTLCMPESGERVAERAGCFGTMGSNNFYSCILNIFYIPGSGWSWFVLDFQ